MISSSRPTAMRLIVAVATILAGLLAATLACTSSAMRSQDQPIWLCPTATLDPSCFATPDGTTAPPPPPPAGCSYETPYEKTSDFPLGRKVIVGAVGGYGIGVWASMDHVRTHGPFIQTDPVSRATRQVWVAQWTITVTNGSLSAGYEFYPQSQLYALDIYDEQGQIQRGAWPISAEAHDLIGLPHLDLTEDQALLAPGAIQPMLPFPFTPGEGITYDVAAIIPGPRPWRFAFIFDPLDVRNIDEMADKNTLGSNVAVWINAYDQVCRYDDIIPQQGQFISHPIVDGPPQPGLFVAGYLLARHPVSGYSITRGFGCAAEWTGFKSPSCSGSTPWFHNGIDYATARGQPYYDTLPVAGSVLYAGPDTGLADCSQMAGSDAPHIGYGNFVKHTATEQGHTVVIWGGHLSALGASTGEPTRPGKVLGAVGSTGCSTGPHVHFAVTVDGRFVDPAPLIPPGAP